MSQKFSDRRPVEHRKDRADRRAWRLARLAKAYAPEGGRA